MAARRRPKTANTNYTIDAWNRIIAVNLGGVVNGVQAAYAAMIRQGFGHIVNTASMAGLMKNEFLSQKKTIQEAMDKSETTLMVGSNPSKVGYKMRKIQAKSPRMALFHKRKSMLSKCSARTCSLIAKKPVERP
jgi:NAD(P)-dependent dehydrogenase (short-subunit alcohol dehydrogenase family)